MARRQIAEVLVGGLTAGGPPGKTFELVAERGPPQLLSSLFAAVDPDRPGDLDGVHDEPNMPPQEEPEPVIHDLNHIRALAGA